MNPQFKMVNGKRVSKGIEWTDWTWNVLGGCLHECQWQMPNGSIARCYAKDVALSPRVKEHYPQGFESHYFHPKRLQEPLKQKAPARIFMDSMSDLMGRWVPESQVLQVLDTVRKADWHVFQMLTKNPPYLLKYADKLPPNLWVLVSSPPDFMWGKPLTQHQQARWVSSAIADLSQLPDRLITGMSIEPLSWNIAPVLRDALAIHPNALKWVIIGAASNGQRLYQPNQEYLDALLALMDAYDVPVFFKGNLSPKMVNRWREDFPYADQLRPTPYTAPLLTRLFDHTQLTTPA